MGFWLRILKKKMEDDGAQGYSVTESAYFENKSLEFDS